MNMKRLLWGFTLIAATALLAGCGGGGGTSLMVGGERATQALIDALQADRNAQANRADEAERERDARPTQQDLTDAQGERDAANRILGAIATALELTGDPTQMDYTDRIMELEDDSEDLAAVRSALSGQGVTATSDRAAIIAAINMLQERPDVPSGPAPTAKTEGVTHGILGSKMTNNPSTFQGLNHANRPGNTGEMVLVRSGDSDNDTTPGIFVGTATNVNTPTADEYTAADQLRHDDMEADPDNAGQMRSVMGQFSDGPATSLSKMFTSTTHERMMEAEGVTTTDTITVVTNIEAPGPLSFTTYYGQADRDGVTGMATMVDHDSDSDTDDVYSLTLNVTEHETLAGLLGGAVAGALPDQRSQTFTFSDNPDGDTDTMDDNRVYENSTFNGVSGTVECTDTCTVVTDSDGDISDITGTWRFLPSGDVSMIMIPEVKQDDDFLAFGWWLRSVEDDDDDNLPYTVGTFATGAQVYTLQNVRDNVEGTAEYSGPAAGKFARKTLAADGSVATLQAGHFTADANLMAYFGGNDVAVNKQFTISGSVTGFDDADGHEIDAGWTVELGEAGFASDTSTDPRGVDPPTGVTAAANTFYGEATGAEGAWQGRFFGNDGDADPVMDGNQFVAPTGVAGEFTGHFSNGHVIGAFGATKD